MSDVSKFNILNKIINIKDIEGRAEALARYNQLLTKMEKEFVEIDNNFLQVDNKFTAVNSAVSKINSKISNFVNVVTDFGADNTATTDCTEALKKAFAVQDAFIYFPAGNYLISDSIKIKSNTYVYGYRALIQNKDSNNMFINDSDGTAGGYNANSHITIDGLWFRGLNMTQTIVAFGHCSDIRIINCDFASNSATHEQQNWHLVEINSCRRVLIENCHFTGTATFKTEMLQLDVATQAMVFPWFGPYDNTPCTNVEISNCNFSHPEKYGYETLGLSDAGIGNHNGANSAPIEYINIHGCHFNNVKTAFKFEYLRFSIIDNNIAENCMSGFAYLTSHIIDTVKITNNTFYGNVDDYTDKVSNTALGRGISIGTLNGQQCSNNIISGNNVIGFATHGIAVNGEFCDVSNNIIRSNGYTGLYTDYDNYKCNFHDNICDGNARLDQENWDLFVSHTHTSKITRSGGNDIYNNKASIIRCAVYSTDNLKSRVHDNVYSEITYPTTFNKLNVYGNTKFDGNPNYAFDNANISSPSGGQWYTPVHFTTDHTCYALINFQVIIPANFVGTFNIRIIDTSSNTTLGFDTIDTSHASSTTHTGGNLTICVKILNGHTISGELFFVYSDKAVTSVDAQIIMLELPVPLENTDTV